MFSDKALARIEHELTAAETARTEGNEGKARVCARRAAGIAIQEYYRSMGEQVAVNVIDAFHLLLSDPRVNPDWHSFAELMLMRVNEDHTLPVQKNVLAETRHFIHEIEKSLGVNQLENKSVIILYGTRWCYDSRRSRRILDQNNIPYQYIDIDTDEPGRKFVEKTNNGFRSVPTIVFTDGSILVEPTDQELKAKLGLGE